MPLSAPNCPHERIYVLPLLTILTNKARRGIGSGDQCGRWQVACPYKHADIGLHPTQGTGIVTSVPSDSPDDYTALMVRCWGSCLTTALLDWIGLLDAPPPPYASCVVGPEEQAQAAREVRHLQRVGGAF